MSKQPLKFAFFGMYLLSVVIIIMTIFRGIAFVVDFFAIQILLTVAISVGILVSSHFVGQATESNGVILRSLKTLLALCLFIALSSPAVFLSFAAFYDLLAVQTGWPVPTKEDQLAFFSELLVDLLQGRGPTAALAVLVNSIIIVSFPIALNILKFRFFNGPEVVATENIEAESLKWNLKLSRAQALVAIFATVEVILGFLSFTYAVAWYFRPGEDYEPTIVLFTVALVVVEIIRKRVT